MQGRSTIGTQVKLTIDNTARALTLPTSGIKPQAALLSVTAANVRWRTDGTAPKADEGVLLAANGTLELHSASDVDNFQAIRTGSTSAVLDVTYYV